VCAYPSTCDIDPNAHTHLLSLSQPVISPFSLDFLSSSQVITWFQNRRAKLKRDIEELKKDVESVKVLAGQPESFLKNVTDMNLLKKKPIPAQDDAMSPEK
jgi:hypothetical protein